MEINVMAIIPGFVKICPLVQALKMGKQRRVPSLRSIFCAEEIKIRCKVLNTTYETNEPSLLLAL